MRPNSGAGSAVGVPSLLGFLLTLGLIAGLIGGVAANLSQLYLRWGMYDLLLGALRTRVGWGIGGGLLLAALVLAGRGLRRRGRALAWVLGGLVGASLTAAVAWPLLPAWREQMSLQLPLALAAGFLAVWLAAAGALERPLGRLARHRGWRSAGALSLLLLALLHGYGLLRRLGGGDGPNVVLVGVDTLRADHLGLYGYARDTSPNLDAWAEGATVFENCIASTPRTTQSLASILTGKYPHRVGVRYLSDALPARELSLAEALKNAGYRTIAVIATGIPYKRLDQGFDVVIDTRKEFSAGEAVDKALAALAEARGKYFLFVFLRDPHMPYEPPELAFGQEYEGPHRKALGYGGNKADTVFKNDFDERLREHAIALYDSEVRYLDGQFGRLMTAVEERSPDNIVVFFSDHGESLGEHDYYYDHGDLLYQPGLRIPCVISGIDFGQRRVGEVVRAVDLAPTVLEAVGIAIPEADLDGVDLAADHPPLEAYSETGRALLKTAFETGRRHVKGLEGRLRSLIYGGMKVIYVPRSRGRFSFELYDLEEDPLELDDLSETVEAEELKRRLLRWVNQDRDNWSKPEDELSEQEARRLRQLGYL